jgi:hypothetical protein
LPAECDWHRRPCVTILDRETTRLLFCFVYRLPAWELRLVSIAADPDTRVRGGTRAEPWALVLCGEKETAMEATETLMAEQLDAIIRRLDKRIEAGADQRGRKGPSLKKLKARLRDIKGIRAHFDSTK